jgi:hypothetical protein
MRQNGYTTEDVTDFGTWWYLKDWRGKKGQAPTLEQIRENWGSFRKWQTNRHAAAEVAQQQTATLPQSERNPVDDLKAGFIANGLSKNCYWFHGISFIDQPNGIARLGLSDVARDWIENRVEPTGKLDLAIEWAKDHNPTLAGIEFVEAT